MAGNNVHDHSFRRKDQVVTLGSRTAVRFVEDCIQVDPQLLFQSLSIVATGGRYENPETDLFDASFLPRQANRRLGDAIWANTRFINHLGDKLQPSGCTVIHVTGDADLSSSRPPYSLQDRCRQCLWVMIQNC